MVRLGGRLVAVEVKTRVEEDPLVQLTERKRASMREAAFRLTPRPSRVDLVAVRLDPGGVTIRWLRGVA